MDTQVLSPDFCARRDFLRRPAGGIGMIALARSAGRGRPEPPLAIRSPKPPHFPAKAKNVIFLFMEGAPSQIDLFDPKPELQKWHGKPLPPSLTKDLQLAFIKPTATVLAQPAHVRAATARAAPSSRLSRSGLGAIADDICLVRSMYTDAFNHHPADLLLFAGHMLTGRPTMGAWVLYGLGSESQNLPGFVVLSSGVQHEPAAQWSSGFLPSTYQGVVFRSTGDPVLYLSNPAGVEPGRAARGLRPGGRARTANAAARPATWRSPRASRPTSWRSACR